MSGTEFTPVNPGHQSQLIKAADIVFTTMGVYKDIIYENTTKLY